MTLRISQVYIVQIKDVSNMTIRKQYAYINAMQIIRIYLIILQLIIKQKIFNTTKYGLYLHRHKY